MDGIEGAADGVAVAALGLLEALVGVHTVEEMHKDPDGPGRRLTFNRGGFVCVCAHFFFPIWINF